MIIYIDANIIIKENFFRSSTSQAFLKAAQFLEIIVIIPEIVLDEVKGNYAKNLPEKLQKYNKAQKDLGTLIEIENEDIDVAEEVKEYNGWLDSLLQKYDVIILAYPVISLKDIVTKSYNSQKPFKQNGEGYKDYLIWENIKQNIIECPQDAEKYLLTENVKDFCHKENNEDWILHPDLSAQLPDDKIPPETYQSLKKYFDEKIAPQLKGVDINSIPELTQLQLYEEAEQEIERALDGYCAYGIEGLNFSNEITIVAINSMDLDKIDLQAIDADEILITISGKVDIEAHGFMEKYVYYSGPDFDEEAAECSVLDGDWNDHVMLVGQSIETPIEITFSYSKEEKMITGSSIDLPNQIFDELL